MDSDEFEWDAAKAESNREKHGVSFEAARCVFDDAFSCEQCDLDSEPGEIRYVLTGMFHEVILTVVYAERGERIRINLGKKSDQA